MSDELPEFESGIVESRDEIDSAFGPLQQIELGTNAAPCRHLPAVDRSPVTDRVGLRFDQVGLRDGARSIVSMGERPVGVPGWDIAKSNGVRPVYRISPCVRIGRPCRINERVHAHELPRRRVVVAVVYDPRFRSGRSTTTAPSWDCR
jgi:hypothetical protein